MISKPASRMGLLRPTSRVAEPKAGSVAASFTHTLSRGIRVRRKSCVCGGVVVVVCVCVWGGGGVCGGGVVCVCVCVGGGWCVCVCVWGGY